MAQEFKIGRLRYTWRGEWNSGITYNRDAVVQYNGKMYICLEPHTTQANFYNDLEFVTELGASTPRWLLTIDGRVWKQEWLPNTFYSVGNTVKYGGIVYICTIPHTSSLQELDIDNWDTYSSFDNWNNNWTVNTVYGVGDIVKYGGIVYRCTFNHVSAATTEQGLEANLSQNNFNYQTSDDSTLGAWEVVNDGIEYKGTWSSAVRYKRNDIVRNGADLYIAIEGHTAVVPFDFQVPGDGLEDSALSDSTNSKWLLWQPGTSIKNTWVDSTTYQIGDIVKYGGYSYRNLISNNINNIPSVGLQDDSTSIWDVVTEGYEYRSEWNGNTAYKIGSVVYQGGTSFVANADSVGESPTAYSVTTNSVFTGSVGTTIKINSTVGIRPGMTMIGAGLFSGQTVVSVVDSVTITIDRIPDVELVDATPINFIGLNYLYWNLLVPSAKHIGYWSKTANYLIGDVVIWANGTYRCIQGHPSGPPSRPDLDVTNTYWSTHILHARENAGNTPGDIVTRSNGANVAVPILDELDEVGKTEDYVLQTESSAISWSNIQIIPNVYYVAPDGEDAANRGNDPDSPWKTIKYACEQIEHGTNNPNTRAILKANKEFLIEEMWQWMQWKKDNNSAPFSSSSVFDEFSTKRDARIILDALMWDITRKSNDGSVTSNTKTVFAALAFFAIESQTTFASINTAAAKDYIVAALAYLLSNITKVIANLPPLVNYQILNDNWTWDIATTYETDDIVFLNDEWYRCLEDDTLGSDPAAEDTIAWEITTAPITIIEQNLDLPSFETGTDVELTALLEIVTTAITEENKSIIPLPNASYTSTVQVKTGSYFEQLPISVPEDTALNGDELRGVIVFPKDSVYTGAVSSNAYDSTITLQALTNVTPGMPIQFFTENVNEDFGNIQMSTTYYVKDIVDVAAKTITISTTVGGYAYPVDDGTGFMFVYAGDCLKDMFYVRDATGIRNMTLQGLAGFLSVRNQFGTQRPTGGAYVSLDPGLGVDDTNVWIKRRSPYIQNVTNFGDGCTGLKINGYLHNGGNKSIVCNDFTQIISDGIGVWCTGPNSLTECVSVFGYYNYAGYFAEDGGRIRATNGNSSYGTYGVIAEGFDVSETPIAATVDNRSEQVQASVQSAFGANAELLSMQYANAGSGYFETTTNILKYSNNFLETWSNDSNVTIQQNIFSPIDEANGWTIGGTTSNAIECYIEQAVSITPTGFFYNGLSTLNVSGSGVGGQFDVTVGATGYTAEVFAGGSGYVTGNTLRVLGSQLGGIDGVNDCFLIVTSLAGSSILGVSVSGTVPTNSNLKYTFSTYIKKGSSNSVDIDAIYSGDTPITSSVNFSFSTLAFTATSVNGGMTPTEFGSLSLPNGWYRIWFTSYDNNALNNTLTIRIWPRGKTGVAATTEFYGSQLQLTAVPTFYLETTTNHPTSNANFGVIGAGTGADLVGNEIRSKSVFQTRLTNTGIGAGGRNYAIASNNAQAGNLNTITLSGADEGTASQYIGMRAFIQSGTGAGQYGFVSNYNPATKVANVMKETFPLLDITETTSGTNLITVGSTTTSKLFLNQPIEFIPTYYQSTVTDTAFESLNVIATTGGQENTLRFSSTAKMSVNMAVRFYGTAFGGLATNFTYYIKEIVDANNIKISTSPFGTTWQLNNDTEDELTTCTMRYPGYNYKINGSTANMLPNMPVQFTGTAIGGVGVGTQYYVNDVLDANNFTISTTLLPITVTSTASTTNNIVYTGSGLVAMNPIIFSGTVVGGLVANTKYYIKELVNATTITVADSLITSSCTATEASTNLITIASTAGFTPDAPVQFIGNIFGGLINGTTYYVLAVNDGTTFTVATSPGGSAVALGTATGEIEAKTPSAEVVLTDTASSFAGVSTNTKNTIAYGYGSMIATYSTSIFGGVSTGTTYYVKTIDSETQFTISSTPGGAAFALNARSGSMNLGEAGWDNINPGTASEVALDSSTVYYIEPRIQFTPPTVQQVPYSLPTIGISTSYNSVAYGNGKFIAIADSGQTAASSTNGTTWTAIPLPDSKTWASVAYGNNYWVIIANGGGLADPGSRVLYSKSGGNGWRTSELSSMSGWTDVAYGNGKFVAIADDSDGTSAASYSTDYGKTWTAGTGITNSKWSSITYNSGTFVAVSEGKTFINVAATGGAGSGARFDVIARSGLSYDIVLNAGGANYLADDIITIPGTSLGGASPANDITITIGTVGAGGLGGTLGEIGTFTVDSGTASTAVGTSAAYSTNGISWTTIVLPSSGVWTDVASGNGLFIATSKYSANPVYSIDGISWLASPYTINAGKIAYGQGVFVALSTISGEGWTSENGRLWKEFATTDNTYGGIVFGWTGLAYDGIFVTVAQQSLSNVITAGTQTQARVTVSSGRITSIAMWEPGSNYITDPTLIITDPNATVPATTQIRTSNGTLGNPSFINKGTGYNTNSTSVKITGGGYADTYQVGTRLTVDGLTRLPGPGDNLVIAGNSTVYKVTSAETVYGTVAPNIKANLRVSPEITTEDSPAHDAAITIRTKYSQARLTGHDFLNVGYGSKLESRYPGVPVDTVLSPQDQAVEINFGRVFYVSTDQDGNFKVGTLFAVEQATGIVTISASQFGLSGLDTLSLGGVSIGNASVIVRQFSADDTFVANSNEIVPTQRAVKAYLEGRLSQGGSNTFTGQLIAGTILVGGPNKIASTIPNGGVGSVVNIPVTANFQGQFASWDGDGMALQYFVNSWVR